jgi:hypothetical protein
VHAASELFLPFENVLIAGRGPEWRPRPPISSPLSAPPNAANIVHAFSSGHRHQLVPVVGAIVVDVIVHGRMDPQIGF